jgi:ribosomal protein S19
MENIYAAGEFYNDSLNYYVAKWDGNSWSELGGRNSLAANEMILSISGDKNGNVFAAGLFTNGLSSQTGKNYVAKWNGLNWSELGGRNGLAANATIQSIQIDKNNNVYAAGIFTNDSVWPSGKHYVAVWNGSNWSEVGGRNALSANSHIADICVDFSNQLYAAGSFTNENSVSLGKKYVAKFSGSSVGIKNEITEVGLSVFPNPVQTQLKVWNNRHSLHGSYLIISDMLGRKVLEFSITESSSVFSIPVQELKNGAYILSLQKEGETSRMKFVKE